MKPSPICILLAATTSAAIPGSLLAQAPPEVRIITVDDSAKEFSPAFAGPVTNAEDLSDDPHGSAATYGDILVKNDQASLVFGDVDDKYEAPRRGRLIDIFPTPAFMEAFEIMTPAMNAMNPFSIQMQSIDYDVNDEDQSATITVKGIDGDYPGLEITTTYEMKPEWPGLRATTTFANENTEGKEHRLPYIGEYFQWGAMEPFIPGVGWGNRNVDGLTKVEFLFGRFDDNILFYHPIDTTISVSHDIRRSRAVYATDVLLKPTDSFEFSRWILTGPKDPSRLLSFVLEQDKPDNYGIMGGNIIENVQTPQGFQQTADVADSEVRISLWVKKGMNGDYTGKPYIFGVSDINGRFQMNLEAGEYRVDSAHPARGYLPNNTTVKIEPKTIQALEYNVSVASGISYEITDAETGKLIPAKLTILPLRGGVTPNLGPSGGVDSNNVSLSASGRGVVDLPAGNYRVVVSHGTEYHTSETRVQVKNLQTAPLKIELNRAFKTDGWISADLGVMTEASSRSRTSTETRITSAVAEGVEWIVSADTDVATDLNPAIRQLDAAGKITATSGLRITSTAERTIGEYTIFPVDNADGFQSVLKTTSPEEAITAIREAAPDAFVTVNRALFPEDGFLNALGIVEGDLSGMDRLQILEKVDGFQLWEGKRQAIVEPSVQTYEGLVARGMKRLVPIGNSLAAGTYNEETGYPRVYVRSSTDDAGNLNSEELIKNLRAGQIQVTNGPFVDFKINGEGPGSLITEDDGIIEVELDVYSANWANVSSVAIMNNGRIIRQILLPSSSIKGDVGHVFPAADKPENGKFRLRISEDSLISIMILGDPTLPQDPVNPFVSQLPSGQGGRGQISMAYVAPIFVDLDGDGKITIPLDAPADETDGPYVPPF